MRKMISIGVGLVAAAAALSLFLRPSATPTITEEQVARIHVGMSLAEVEGLLGCPPGNYTYHNDFLPIDMRDYEPELQRLQEPFREWAANTSDPQYTDAYGANWKDAIAVRVWFDKQGRVIAKFRLGHSYTLHPTSVLDRLLEWLSRWRRLG
jgi:hypothetical protein